MKPLPSEHEKRIHHFYDGDPERYVVKSPLSGKGVFVLFTNRSGSNYLVSLLGQLPTVALENEIFNWDAVINFSGQAGLKSFDEYVGHLRGRSPKPCWGAKVEYSQVNMLWRFGVFQAFESGVRFVWIRRKNVVAQAVSYFIAFKTKQWASFHKASAPVPEYDYEFIDRMVTKIARSDADVLGLMNVLGLPFESLWYEDFVERPRLHIKRLAQFLEEPFDQEVKLRASPFKRQANAVNDEYEQRFLEEARRRHHLDPAALTEGSTLRQELDAWSPKA